MKKIKKREISGFKKDFIPPGKCEIPISQLTELVILSEVFNIFVRNYHPI